MKMKNTFAESEQSKQREVYFVPDLSEKIWQNLGFLREQALSTEETKKCKELELRTIRQTI